MDITPYINMVHQDIGSLDITSALIPPREASARIIAKEKGHVSGISLASALFEAFGISPKSAKGDGDEVAPGDTVMTATGDIRALLGVERTILNILQRMSGITTMVVDCRKAAPGVRIAATRKTLQPDMDKMAVMAGGGDPHRWRLDDMYLIKDNHLAVMSIHEAVFKARKTLFSKKVEVEVETLVQAKEAAEAGADIIMLDNMGPDKISDTIASLRKEGYDKVLFEASGTITPDTLPSYAKAGVDIVSMGWITHSVKALDLSMEIR